MSLFKGSITFEKGTQVCKILSKTVVFSWETSTQTEIQS